MLREGTQDNFIRKRVNMPTEKSHAELVSDVASQIKARAFFSARVAEGHILDRLRDVSDRYSRGEMGLGEARNMLKDFLRGQGLDPHQAGMRNLASTGRLNLILRQNASMAKAAGEWKRMHDPDQLAVFPYVRYHSRNDGRTRGSHDALNGKIFDKNDPFLKTHTPPWEFNCRCWLEEITAKEAGDNVEPLTKPEDVRVESESGFVFDPEEGLGTFAFSGVKNPMIRGDIREQAEMEFGDQVHFMRDNSSATFENKQYITFADKGLKSSQLWKKENMPPLPQKQSPEDAKKKLEDGVTVQDPDGKTIIFGKKVLEHWQNKSKNEQDGRLARLNRGLETVQNPAEIWDQDTQIAYIQAFRPDGEGKPKGCLVFVGKDGEAITYFPKDLKELDKARKGSKVKVLPVSDAKQPAPEMESPHPAPTQDREQSTPDSGKVKEVSQKTPENIGKRLQNLAKEVELTVKKSEEETAAQFASILEDRMKRLGVPAFSKLQAETQKNTVGGILGDKFSVNLSMLKNAEKRWEKMKADADKHGGHPWTFAEDKDDLVRAFVDHEIGHSLLTRSGKMKLVAEVFEKAGVSHPKLDEKGNVIRNERGTPVMIMDAIEISRYAALSDPHEFFAEAFNKYMSTRRDELPEYIRKMVEEIIGRV